MSFVPIWMSLLCVPSVHIPNHLLQHSICHSVYTPTGTTEDWYTWVLPALGTDLRRHTELIK